MLSNLKNYGGLTIKPKKTFANHVKFKFGDVIFMVYLQYTIC